MDVNLNTITIGNTKYQYDPDVIENKLQNQSLSPEQVEQVLKEIAAGDATAVHKYGLNEYVTDSNGLQLPDETLDADSLNLLLGKLDGMNMLAVLYALHEAGQELRKAAKEMRHAERDSAQSEAFLAAAKIRSSAIINAWIGAVSGVINMGMGIFSTVSSVKQLMALKAPLANVNAAKTEVAKAKADAKLADSQVRLNQAKADARAATSPEAKAKAELKVKELEAEVRTNSAEAAKANSEQTASLEKTIKEKETEIEGLKKDQGKARKEISAARQKLGEKTIKGDPADIKKAEANVQRAEDKFADIESRLKAAENSLPKLRQDLAESKAMNEIYNNPTSDASLKGADDRLAASNSRATAAEARQQSAELVLNKVVADGNLTAGRNQGLNSISSGLTQAGQGIGGIFSAGEQADGAKHTAESQKAASMESESAEFQKTADELMAAVRSIVKETLQAYNQANSAIYRNM